MRARNGALALAMLFPLGAAIAMEVSGCTANGKGTTTSGTGAAQGGSGPGGGTTTTGTGTGTGGNTGGGGGDVGGFGGGMQQGSGGLTEDAACVATKAEATLTKKPVDVIFIIDNSGSMGDNIKSVQDNINANFAAIIEKSGIDYRVIMVSQHGALGSESICIQAPLSTSNCNPVPKAPGQNPPKFFHYSIPVESHDSWCQALKSYDGTLKDEYGLGPGGWKTWLRKEALKVFVEITDDRVSCSYGGITYNDLNTEAGGKTASAAFDAALLKADPEQFGDAMNRNYIWHSIIGVKENNPATKEYAPPDPVVIGKCSTAVNGGTGYQVLSQVTGGLRFPICQFASFDVVFQAIATGVIEGAKVDCNIPIPEAPAGQMIDLSTVVLQYTPMGDGNAQLLKQVPTAADCKPDSFYIETNTIKLCPDACTVVQADNKAKLSVLFGCNQDPT